MKNILKTILIFIICLNIQISYSQTNQLALLATNRANQTASFNLKGDYLTINSIKYLFTYDTKSCTLTQIVGSINIRNKKNKYVWLRLVILIEPQELKVYNISTGTLSETFEF
jgi:hypothetical protein